MRSISCLLLLYLAMSGHAQEITFTASVDRNSIAIGETVKLTVTLMNSREKFMAPDLGGLVVVQGPFESSSFNYVNGQMTSSVSRTWVLTGTEVRSYTIGPAKVRVGGGVIQTDPITVEVTKGSTQPVDPNALQGQKRDPDLFVTIELSKSKAYVGEQVVANYTLYSRYPNLELSKYDLPKLNGFWAEDIELGEQGWEDRPRVINGLQYRVAVLKKQLLFPQRSGKLQIDPVQLTCIVNRSFFSRGTAIDVRSNAVEFIAQELPPNAPAGFSGAVGELQMTVQADKLQVQADDALDLTVRLTGRTNLKLLDAPVLGLPQDFEVFDPKINDKITVNANGMSGTREFQYVIIPRHEGSYPVEPITFSYFDTRSGSYRTLKSDPLTIEVSPGRSGPVPGRSSTAGRDVAQLDQDIRYIRLNDLGLRVHGDRFFGSGRWVAGVAAPAMAFLLFLVWYRQREAGLQDEAGMRRRKADKVARQRLAQAEKALGTQDQDVFHQALSKALHGYLADKFGLGIADVNNASIRERATQLPTGAAEEFIELMNTCDMARYAPVGTVPSRELYARAADLIGRMERSART